MAADITWDDFALTPYSLATGTVLLATDLAFYPLELLQTRMQFEQGGYTSMTGMGRQVLCESGPRGLFRGCLVFSAGAIPGKLLHFGGYEYAKHTYAAALDIPPDESDNASLTAQRFVLNLAAGFTGDAIGLLIDNPAEVIGQRLMVSTPDQPRLTAASVLRTTLQREGLMGLYRGYGASLAAYGPASATWFAFYELSKHHAVPGSWGETANHLCSGSVAGFVSTVISNPMDVAKTRYQIAEESSAHHKMGFSGVLREVYREEGMRGLARGMWPRLVVAVPASAVTLALYELAKQWARDWS